MIPCPLCNFMNPLGTRFCRGCGEKIETKLSMVNQSVTATKQSDRETSIFKMGMSALSIGGFLFIAAVIFRNTLVPEMPAPDLPPVAVANLVPDSMLKPPPRTAVVVSSSRLSWRLNQGSTLLKDLGVEVDHVHGWQDAILKAQKDDGGYAGSDNMLSTALGALALQAFPTNEYLAGAARARTWLKNKALKELANKPAMTRSLVLTALIDAEDMPADLWTADKQYLVDGQSAVWQATGVALLKTADRKGDHSILRNSSTDGLWTGWWDAVEGKPTPVPDSAFATVDTGNLVAGEDRLMWTQEAWFLVGNPDEIRKNLEAWSRTDPVQVDPNLLAKTGPWAPSAVAVLTVASPIRMPPLALSAP